MKGDDGWWGGYWGFPWRGYAGDLLRVSISIKAQSRRTPQGTAACFMPIQGILPPRLTGAFPRLSSQTLLLEPDLDTSYAAVKQAAVGEAVLHNR